MSEGQIVMALQALFLALAWYWHGGSERMVAALTGSFLVALLLSEVLSGINLQIGLSLLDCAVVYLASHAWIALYDLRGWWIGFLGFGKLATRFWFNADLGLDHWFYAAVLNATFIAQIIIAGGLADGLGRQIADHLRSAGPRRARLLRNVEGR